jgi:hypothetical protein
VGAPMSSIELSLAGDEDVVGSHSPKGTVCCQSALPILVDVSVVQCLLSS